MLVFYMQALLLASFHVHPQLPQNESAISVADASTLRNRASSNIIDAIATVPGVIILNPNPFPEPDTLTAGVSSEYQSNNGLAAYSLYQGGNRNGTVPFVT